jgi:cytosine/adenosine deaminase-related metal-dependent hydrolase
MLVTSARRASKSLGVTLGKLAPHAAADVVVTDYIPFTPLNADNFAGHFLFAMSAGNVRHVIANGHMALCERVVQTCDEAQLRAQASAIATKLWQRMDAVRD